jgi:hypothetical protein
MHTVDHGHDATDRDAVEALAATLDLPRGQVDQAELALWSERVTARGWVVDEHTDDHYLLRHPASGFRADLHLLRYTPDDAEHPLSTPDDGDALHYAFSTVRLSDPDGTGLLADANLTQPSPDGTVPWLIAYSGAAPNDARAAGEHEASANPFHRTILGQLGAAVRRPPFPLGLAIGTIAMVLVVATWLRLRQESR